MENKFVGWEIVCHGGCSGLKEDSALAMTEQAVEGSITGKEMIDLRATCRISKVEDGEVIENGGVGPEPEPEPEPADPEDGETDDE